MTRRPGTSSASRRGSTHVFGGRRRSSARSAPPTRSGRRARCSTASSARRCALVARCGRRPLLLIDLAVPRDLDPEIGTLPYAFLYDVDDLDEAVGTGSVEGAAARAEAIVAEEAERFRAWQASRGVVPAIASLRARAEEIRLGELQRAGRRLADLSPEERRAVDAVTVQIVNKLLHDPTVRLKEAAAGADGAAYADAVRHLFGLDSDQDRQPG